MDETRQSAFESEIRARIAELEAADRATEADRAPVELDQQSVGRLSRMDALQVQAMAAAQSRRRSVELGRLRAALRRIAEDEFGWCDGCGEAIPEGRLRLDPSVTRCVSCASGG